ncbi:hypothetical protein [Paraburkholderia sp. GAS334]|uniref:hypothetical protein n=1 Tax=Paraburkholderia sp. GAS334 TaxID=3035131 RepID=UPI003D214285
MNAWSTHCRASRGKRLLSAIAMLLLTSLCVSISACSDDEKPATSVHPDAPSITATDTPPAATLTIQTPAQAGAPASESLVTLATPVIHTAD